MVEYCCDMRNSDTLTFPYNQVSNIPQLNLWDPIKRIKDRNWVDYTSCYIRLRDDIFESTIHFLYILFF
jgi:hypothetical protein